MWLRRILRKRTFCNNPAIYTFLQRWTNENDITFRRPMRRFLSSNEDGYTIGEALDLWSHRFKIEDVSEPIESIEHIMAHIIGTKKITDIMDMRNDRLSPSQIEKLEALCVCRLSRMPVQYIIGEWDFRDITIKLVPPIFIPRPETEILVDLVLKRVNSSQADTCEILEIGCGSGAVSLALVNACKKIKCIAIDANPYACDLTFRNMNKLSLTDQITVMHAILKSDATIEVSRILNSTDDVDLTSKMFDFIVSNPPYIPTKRIPKLQDEIKIYEDLTALDGGEDGLKIIKPLLKYAAKALKPGGRLLLEVDTTHPEYIQFFINKYSELKLHNEHTYKDFCNNDRFVEIMKIT